VKRRWKDPYVIGIGIFIISLGLIILLPDTILAYGVLAAWTVSIFLIGWAMGHKAKEKLERGGFGFAHKWASLCADGHSAHKSASRKTKTLISTYYH
jgi:hypothetical protein